MVSIMKMGAGGNMEEKLFPPPMGEALQAYRDHLLEWKKRYPLFGNAIDWHIKYILMTTLKNSFVLLVKCKISRKPTGVKSQPSKFIIFVALIL